MAMQRDGHAMRSMANVLKALIEGLEFADELKQSLEILGQLIVPSDFSS